MLPYGEDHNQLAPPMHIWLPLAFECLTLKYKLTDSDRQLFKEIILSIYEEKPLRTLLIRRVARSQSWLNSLYKLEVPIVSYAKVLKMRDVKMGTAVKGFLSREVSKGRVFIEGIKIALVTWGAEQVTCHQPLQHEDFMSWITWSSNTG